MQKATYLKFWIMPVGGNDTSQIIGREIEEFEKSHPGIKVDLSVVPWTQAWKDIITAAKRRQLPDIFQIGNTWTKTLTSISSLADLTERVSEDKMKSKFHPVAWSTCEDEATGNVFAVPWGAEARMLFYRKDIFKKAKLSIEDVSTWDQFYNTCKTINGCDGGNGPIGALGIPDIKDQGLVHDVAPWVWSGGGDYLTKDGLYAAFNKPEAVKGIKLYFDLMEKDYAPIRDRKVPGYAVYDFFVSGKYGMCIAGAFVAAGYLPGFFGTSLSCRSQEMMDKFGVAALPAGPGGRFSFLGGSDLAISNHSMNKHEAWQFIKFLTSNDTQIRLYKNIGALPSGIEPFASLFCQGTEQEKILKQTYSDYGRSYRQIDFWGGVEFIISELFGSLIDSIKSRKYDERLLSAEIAKYAGQVDYILSL
ncbi:MAG: extracellular solute-binding protein [Candidatus Omnitrophota bacterium]